MRLPAPTKIEQTFLLAKRATQDLKHAAKTE